MDHYMDRYQLCQSIRFKIQGKRLSPQKVNPILARFSILLSKFKVEENGLRAWISSLSDFKVLKDTSDLVIFEYSSVKWEVSDSGQDSVYNLNNVVRPWLHQCIQKIELEESRVKISSFEARFPHEFWDKEI